MQEQDSPQALFSSSYPNQNTYFHDYYYHVRHKSIVLHSTLLGTGVLLKDIANKAFDQLKISENLNHLRHKASVGVIG